MVQKRGVMHQFWRGVQQPKTGADWTKRRRYDDFGIKKGREGERQEDEKERRRQQNDRPVTTWFKERE
jgi:hypothetical protein